MISIFKQTHKTENGFEYQRVTNLQSFPDHTHILMTDNCGKWVLWDDDGYWDDSGYYWIPNARQVFNIRKELGI